MSRSASLKRLRNAEDETAYLLETVIRQRQVLGVADLTQDDRITDAEQSLLVDDLRAELGPPGEKQPLWPPPPPDSLTTLSTTEVPVGVVVGDEDTLSPPEAASRMADAAGAVVTGETLGRAQQAGLDVNAYLVNNDAYAFFRYAYHSGSGDHGVFTRHIGLNFDIDIGTFAGQGLTAALKECATLTDVTSHDGGFMAIQRDNCLSFDFLALVLSTFFAETKNHGVILVHPMCN